MGNIICCPSRVKDSGMSTVYVEMHVTFYIIKQ